MQPSSYSKPLLRSMTIERVRSSAGESNSDLEEKEEEEQEEEQEKEEEEAKEKNRKGNTIADEGASSGTKRVHRRRD